MTAGKQHLDDPGGVAVPECRREIEPLFVDRDSGTAEIDVVAELRVGEPEAVHHSPMLTEFGNAVGTDGIPYRYRLDRRMHQIGRVRSLDQEVRQVAHQLLQPRLRVVANDLAAPLIPDRRALPVRLRLSVLA